MVIEIDDEIALKCGVDRNEALTLLAIAIYKNRGVHASLAGKIIGLSEFEFHCLLSARGEVVNYDADDLINDIKNNDL